jgi:catechol 2,3-dioxygenase-like lactoylglutathione lyase family enzyme
MIDHIGIRVSNLQKSKAFYIAAFAPINYQLLMEFPAAVTGTVDVAGFGEAPKPDFWISEIPETISPVHVAFTVSSRDKVDAFYKAALAAGGRDNGAPGVRPHYHPDYYGAFILDPDGHNIEAVCHQPA